MKNIRRVRPALCLMVLLQLTAASSELPSIIVRGGENVTLPSGPRNRNEPMCKDVDWIISGSGGPVSLVTRGQVKPERLALTANCSLVIKKVRSEDVGIYHFQQIVSGQDTQFYLSVVLMSHSEEDEKVRLTCSVPAPYPHTHTVKWVYEGSDNPKTELRVDSTTVSILHASDGNRSAFLDLYKCEVTDSFKNTKHLFGFRPLSTDQEPAPTTKPTTEPTTTTERGGLTETSSVWTIMKDWWIFIVAAGVLVVVVITVVLIIRWRKTKGKKRKSTDDTELSLNPTAPPQPAPETCLDTEDPDAEVSYAAVSYTKKKKGPTVQTPDDCDTVTYSTLRASSPPPPAAAADDPSSIYTTVRKNTHTPS